MIREAAGTGGHFLSVKQLQTSGFITFQWTAHLDSPSRSALTGRGQIVNTVGQGTKKWKKIKRKRVYEGSTWKDVLKCLGR